MTAMLARVRVEESPPQSSERASGERFSRVATNVPGKTAAPEALQKASSRSWARRAVALLAAAAFLGSVGLVAHRMEVLRAENQALRARVRLLEAKEMEGLGGRRPSSDTIDTPDFEDDTSTNDLEARILEENAPAGELTPHSLVIPSQTLSSSSARHQIAIRTSCGDPNVWTRPIEIRYPVEALKAGVEGTMHVSCDLDARGSLYGCVAVLPEGFTALESADVLRAMNTWSLPLSTVDPITGRPRCIFEVRFGASWP